MAAKQRHLHARVLDRLFDRRPTVRRAVMRIADQEPNALPTVCVKSGVRTDFVAQTWVTSFGHADGWTIAVGHTATVTLGRLLRRPRMRVSIPASERAQRTWQSRLKISVAVTSIGAAFVIVGVLRGIGALVAIGAIALVLGWLNRVRAWHNAWVGLEYRPGTAEVIVSRVHSAFDAEAAEIYRRSVLRKR